MEKRTEFPALEAHKADLEHQLAEARKQASEGVITGRLELAVELWMKRVQQELEEMNYVLKMVGSQKSRIEVTGHMLVIALLTYALIMAAVVAFIIRYLGA